MNLEPIHIVHVVPVFIHPRYHIHVGFQLVHYPDMNHLYYKIFAAVMHICSGRSPFLEQKYMSMHSLFRMYLRKTVVHSSLIKIMFYADLLISFNCSSRLIFFLIHDTGQVF